MAKVKQLKEKEISPDPKVMEVWTDDELYHKQTELTTTSAELVRDMQKREYDIDFTSKKLLNELLKFLEKDAEWGHTTATGLIMLYHNLREAKESAKDKDWNGNIKLRAANVTILWTMVTKMTGKGFYSAKSFVELMAQIGQSLSTVTQKVHEDNQELRDVHANLGFIESEMENRKLEIGADASIQQEVDPVVENI